jgi:hypothetical protein
MLAEPKCFTRSCKHYLGIDQPDGSELSERNYCEAFPQGIPSEIAYGEDPHNKPWPDQENNIVFEFGEMP